MEEKNAAEVIVQSQNTLMPHENSLSRNGTADLLINQIKDLSDIDKLILI
jgi:hypothetical protein